MKRYSCYYYCSLSHSARNCRTLICTRASPGGACGQHAASSRELNVILRLFQSRRSARLASHNRLWSSPPTTLPRCLGVPSAAARLQATPIAWSSHFSLPILPTCLCSSSSASSSLLLSVVKRSSQRIRRSSIPSASLLPHGVGDSGAQSSQGTSVRTSYYG